MELELIVSRLKGIRPTIEEILSIAGSVGLSYGVVHNGNMVHVDNFGYRNLEEKLPVDENTMFPICSMTKGLVSSVLGLLVEDGKLSWDTPVHQVLPSFTPRSQLLQHHATLLDFLSMRSGIESYNVWTQSDNNINFPKSESIKIINSLQSAAELRYAFAYNNWGYEIAGHVCEEVGGESWDVTLHTKFFDLLGLKRTDARGQRNNYDNIAEAYTVLDNGNSVRIPVTTLSGQTLMGPAGGVQSCTTDLISLYQVILKACIHQFESGETSTPGSPFKQLGTIMSAHTVLPGASLRESSYGLGWIRTQLPNQMCKISPNYGLLGDAPVVGRGAPSKLILAHYGSMPGNFSGVNLFPETESAIIVLTNTTPLCDMADWMTRLLTQTLFDFPEQVDYVSWVKKTKEAELRWHEGVVSEMRRKQNTGTIPRNLIDYVGKYFNSSKTLLIEVVLHEKSLALMWEGREDDLWPLEHYEYDTFSWLQPRNELVRRARSVGQAASYYLVRFEDVTDTGISRLFWRHDSQMPRGEEYVKGNQNSVVIQTA